MYSQLTLKELQAEERRGAGAGVVDGLLAQVVRGVDVPAELHQQVDEAHVLRLGGVVQRRLVQLGRVHVGPWRDDHRERR